VESDNLLRDPLPEADPQDGQSDVEAITRKATEVREIKPRFGPGSDFQGKPGRSGAPIGNRNNLRHGLRTTTLPKGCESVENDQFRARTMLENAVMRVKGKVDEQDAGYILLAVDGIRRSKLSGKWLRDSHDKLSPADRERYSEGVSKGLERFIKFVEKLKLDRDTSDRIVDALYSRTLPTPEDTNGAA
jgi:hypothetical protein